MNLKDKKCEACEGYERPFEKEEIEEHLKQIKDWQVTPDNSSIKKEFILNNFLEALEFINRVGEIAESEDHHPDIHLHDYKKVTITLSTHAIGGLSKNDFIEAAKIDDMKN